MLANEALLLGGLRGDVEFIKEEMECMNSLILQLTEAQHRDYQVRSWMRQVISLTRDCDGNIELYVHYVGGGAGGDGLLGCLRRILRFLRTILVRHQIATQIRELKVRARDVGDRRQRYGVTVPLTQLDRYHAMVTAGKGALQPGRPEEEEEQDLRRRQLLWGEAPDTIEEGTKMVLGWLSEAAAAEDSNNEVARPTVISIVGEGAVGKTAIAKRVYQHRSVVSSFQLRA